MRAEVLPLAELDERQTRAWGELADRAQEQNPFLRPEFVLPAARALERTDVQLLAVRDGEELRACVPVLRRRGWRRAPFIGLIGWRHLYSCLGTPLVDPADPHAAIGALLDQLDRDRSAAFLALELINVDGEFHRILGELLAERGIEAVVPRSYERASLHRRQDGDYLRVRPKRLREWQRQRRRLAEKLDGEVETFDRSAEAGAADDFLRLEASGWKGERGTDFASSGHADFFREVCRSFASRGELQLLALEAGGRRLAMLCNLTCTDGSYTFKIAYDAALSDYSPGIQLELDTIDFFHRHSDAPWMDSCADPDNAMINRLWPDRRGIEAIVIPARGVRGRLSRAGIAVAAALRGGRASDG